MKQKVKLLSSSQEFEVNEDETILSAALRSGIPYPYSCQAGRCGACKSRVIIGEVEHLSHLRFTLTEQEKSEGVILACRAKPKTALELNWLGGPAQDFSSKNFEAEVTKKESLTHDTYRIFAQVLNTDFAFHPGQFAMVQFKDLKARSYSMANQPDGRTLEFFIRKIPQGTVSSYVADSLSVGERISISGPFGQSYLRKEHRTYSRGSWRLGSFCYKKYHRGSLTCWYETKNLSLYRRKESTRSLPDRTLHCIGSNVSSFYCSLRGGCGIK
jgi:ferredoxin